MLQIYLPNGAVAYKTKIIMHTLDLQTLELKIEVGGFDEMGNKLVSLIVPYKLDALRDVPDEELNKIVSDFVDNSRTKQANSA